MVKLAFEEWRYWLEGAQQPFLVWTEHKNLEYISSAKWLNFKPDTLSRHFVGKEGPARGLPPPCVVTLLFRDIEERVWAAMAGQPGSSACPDN